MQVVIKYQSEDGALWDSEQQCLQHESEVAELKEANHMLGRGSNLLECLKVVHKKYGPQFKFTGEQQDALQNITRDSKIVIQHWQGNREPMYSPSQINLGGNVYFWGIGGWSGCTGGWLSVDDIVRYWAHTQEASK